MVGHTPLPLVILPFALIFGLVTCTITFAVVANKRLARAAQFEGSPVTGTAQVLSAVRAGGFTGDWGGSGDFGVYRIGLRVSIPGRPPYDATVTTTARHGWAYYAMRRADSGTYVVEVDSANPERVRFDYKQIVTPPGSYPDPYGAQAQRTPGSAPIQLPGRRRTPIVWVLLIVAIVLALLAIAILLMLLLPKHPPQTSQEYGISAVFGHQHAESGIVEGIAAVAGVHLHAALVGGTPVAAEQVGISSTALPIRWDTTKFWKSPKAGRSRCER